MTKSHSRPYVSDDTPFSEAQFKTLKYRPDFPERFGSIEHARAHCRGFFPWYNAEHRHSGIALITPEDVHYGRTTAILEARAATLDAAFAANPNRFKGRRPTPQRPPQKRSGSTRPSCAHTTPTSDPSNTHFPRRLSQIH